MGKLKACVMRCFDEAPAASEGGEQQPQKKRGGFRKPNKRHKFLGACMKDVAGASWAQIGKDFTFTGKNPQYSGTRTLKNKADIARAKFQVCAEKYNASPSKVYETIEGGEEQVVEQPKPKKAKKAKLPKAAAIVEKE